MKSEDKIAENAKVQLHTTLGVKKPAYIKPADVSSNEDHVLDDSQIEQVLPTSNHLKIQNATNVSISSGK